MSIETPQELAGLRRAGQAVAATLAAVREAVAPGVRTAELDAIAARTLETQGARSAPIVAPARLTGHGIGRATVFTADGSRAAHEEHTIVVTADGPLVLTA